MRIAYIAPYQGPTLLDRRPIVRNRSMSNRIKIELIAGLLHACSHEVEVLSQGEVVDNEWKFYAAFSEADRFHPEIPVHYASALPIRRVNGFWSDLRTLHLFKIRHHAAPFDLVIIFNMKSPQVLCANYAIRSLKIPVILEYEDDKFVTVLGEKAKGVMAHRQQCSCLRLLQRISGCMAVSPHLLHQVPKHIPRTLLRGVVGGDIIKRGKLSCSSKRNRILFSGTHIESNGVAQLIQAWPLVRAQDWELHITGFGHLTDSLRKMAANVPGIIFHGLVTRAELVELMCSAKLCVNPHAISKTPGNVFAFKIIEYLAAGAHVITTPMGVLEPEIEEGITYIPANDPQTIATSLKQAIKNRDWERGAQHVVSDLYGPAAVSQSIEAFLLRLVPPKLNAERNLERVAQ